MTLQAIVHEAEEGGFWTEVPALPGCVTQGDSLEEVEANLREAIQGWLSVAVPPAVTGEKTRTIQLAL